MAGFSIDKGVPLPDVRSAGGRRSEYPWLELEIGDSFLIPFDGRAPERVQSNTMSAAKRQEKRGLKFTSRREPTGLRVWRVA